MARTCDKVDVRVPPTLARPTWADPRYTVATSNVTTRLFSAGGAGVFNIFAANPKRWALGITLAGLFPGVGFFGIDANLPTMALFQKSDTGLTWFELFKFGPLVTRAWFWQSGGATDLVLTEVTIH